MKTRPPVRPISPRALIFSIAVALGALLASAGPSRAAAFVPGEILVVQENNNSVQRYSATGTLLQTYFGLGPGPIVIGAALTPDGNLLIASGPTNSSSAVIYSPGGAQITSFPLTGNVNAGDVSVLPNGTFAVSDGLGNAVRFWNQAGTLLRSVTLNTGPSFNQLIAPNGSTVGSDGSLYVLGFNSFNVARFDSGGNVLSLFPLGFRPGDLVMSPLDGTLWVTGTEDTLVHHFTTGGIDLGSFASGMGPGFDGIALAADNNSLYVASQNNTVVKHFALNGSLLGSFNVINPAGVKYLTVVPNAAPTPEPGRATLLLGGLALLATRRGRASA